MSWDAIGAAKKWTLFRLGGFSVGGNQLVRDDLTGSVPRGCQPWLGHEDGAGCEQLW